MWPGDGRLLRFIVVGGGNTVLGLGVIFIAKQVTDDVNANFVGYLLMVPLTFLSHRYLTFRDTGSQLPAFGRYLVSIMVGYIGNRLVLSWALNAEVDAYISQIFAIAAHVVLVYLLSVVFVFTSYRIRDMCPLRGDNGVKNTTDRVARNPARKDG